MMAGGIDKQIDLSCQLVQDFGCSKQCGTSVSNLAFTAGS